MNSQENLIRLRKNLVTIFLLAFLFLFLGLAINFYLLIQIPQHYIIITSENDLQEQNLLIGFGVYLLEFFSGDWGYSFLEFLTYSVVPMIEILIIPLIGGLILGKYLGKKVERIEKSNLKKTINILFGIGAITMVFWFGPVIQQWFLDILPDKICCEWDSGYVPPVVTGSLLIDSMIAGEWSLTFEVFLRYIIPSLFLTVSITAFFANQRIRKSSEAVVNNSIISNILRTSMNFSMVFMYYIIVDITFKLRGFGYDLLRSLQIADLLVLKGLMFMILICFIIVIFISNLKLTIARYLLKERFELKVIQKIPDEGVGNKFESDFKDGVITLKRYFFGRLKSPLTIIGLILLGFFIFISIFPQIITPYSVEEALNWEPDSWDPPSEEHPLGQIYMGFDLLAHLIYGIRGMLFTGGIAILIGLIGGLLFGIIASQFKQSDKILTIGVMVPFYIFPNILMAVTMATIAWDNYSVLAFIIGLSLIPMFTMKIAQTKPRFTDITKELIIFIPWALIFAIFLYISVGFLGFSDYRDFNLGFMMQSAYDSGVVIERYRAAFWPGLALFIVMIGLLLVHEGLKKGTRVFNPIDSISLRKPS